MSDAASSNKKNNNKISLTFQVFLVDLHFVVLLKNVTKELLLREFHLWIIKIQLNVILESTFDYLVKKLGTTTNSTHKYHQCVEN